MYSFERVRPQSLPLVRHGVSEVQLQVPHYKANLFVPLQVLLKQCSLEHYADRIYLVREASELSTSPSPDYHASPASDSDLFEWHFTLRGPPSSSFASGIYHGRIVLPPTYPLRPPSFRFLTPSGRFETNREICLSISGHHEETWQPAWGIRTALVALRSFMETDAKGQLGGLDTNDVERKRYADRSVSWKCPGCGKTNEDILKECAEAAREKEVVDGEARRATEETVPPELKIAFKPDRVENSLERPEQRSTTTTPVQREAEVYPPARPAQGVPQPTGTPVSGSSEHSQAVVTAAPRNIHPETPVQHEAETYSPARPAHGVPQPTGTPAQYRSESSQPVVTATPQSRQTSAALRATRVRQLHVSNDNDLVWVDRAIAGVVVCLVFMVTKVFLGL